MKLDFLPECWEFKKNYSEIWDSFGCGPGGFGDFLVPDKVWGLSIRLACAGHDFEYRYAEDRSKKARKAADIRLLKNSLTIVRTKSGSVPSKSSRNCGASARNRIITNATSI